MQHFKALRTRTWFAISLILGFALVTFGCATGKNKVSDVNIGLKAEAVPEGICVTFENIPPETTRLFIFFNKGLIQSPPASPQDDIMNYADIMGSSLEQVKKTRKIVFPIVQSGEKYRVSVKLTKESFQPIEGVPEWIDVECVASNGTYFNEDIELKLNDKHTSVALSSEPKFSSEVIFDTRKYSFYVTIFLKIDETEILSRGAIENFVDSSIWTFEPDLTDTLKKSNDLENGTYPVLITALCNIVYDNITWKVEIAKTPMFTYSL